ncbi:MAG: hypothetical protein WCO90_04085 [Planctomycetota bacterium]
MSEKPVAFKLRLLPRETISGNTILAIQDAVAELLRCPVFIVISVEDPH